MRNSWGNHRIFFTCGNHKISWTRVMLRCQLVHTKFTGELFPHEFLMVSSWFLHDLLTISSWIPHDFLMNSSWFSNELFMISTWFILSPKVGSCYTGICTYLSSIPIFSWGGFHEKFMRNSWEIHGELMRNWWGIH